MSPVRQSAARVLLDVDAGRATLSTALDRAHAQHADRRDHALLVELTTGTLRWRNELDALVADVSRRPVDGLEAPVRAVVRLGAYQLRHLDRVPPHAVVHEAVETVRALGRPRAAGFVNAVLRALARGEGVRALPARPTSSAGHDAHLAYLTITLSHPAWLVERWIVRYGVDDARRWCEFNNRPPTLTIRPRGPVSIDEIARRLEAAGLPFERAPFVEDALRLPPGTLGRLPDAIRAEVRVQDEGSQLVARLVRARPGERVLDVCAAPGGKTLVLATDLSRPATSAASLLVAADRRPRRLAILASTLRSADVSVPLVGLDATRPLPFGPVFDKVLLDAPCSGLGTLRRDPDLKWTRQPHDLPGLAAAEHRMLAMAAEVVRPGGELIYATCSSEPDENLDVVRAFLGEDSRFALAPFADQPAGLIDPAGHLVTSPVVHGLDAFFAARLVRRERA